MAIKRSGAQTYSAHYSLRGTKCFYCGGIGNTVDHFPPLAKRRMSYASRILVRCCWECNSYLGDTLQHTVLERKRVALKRLLPEKINENSSRKREVARMKKEFSEDFKKEFEKIYGHLRSKNKEIINTGKTDVF